MIKWHDNLLLFLHAVVCERLRTYIARYVCRRSTNFETTDRYGTMPSLRLLRAVEKRRGDLKQHGACYDKIPPLGLQYSTVTAPRLTATSRQILNSLRVSFLTNKVVEIHMTRTCQTSLCPSSFTHWFNDLRSFRFKTWSKALNHKKKKKNTHSCPPRLLTWEKRGPPLYMST